jgi:hypothetical protein
MPAEVKALVDNLGIRERTLVLLAVSTGLRQSELFGLKWGDIEFAAGHMHVTRSIVYGVVGSCKTEASQKPVPIHPILSEALLQWRIGVRSTRAEDWVFASRRYQGRRPYWGQAILRKYIRPVAQSVGIQKRFGWHTFRHTYSTLLRSVGTEFKVMQELLRHSTLRSTLDVYTQAITPAKRSASSRRVAGLFFRCEWRTGNSCYLARQKKGTKRARNAPFSRPRWFPQTPPNSFEINGGDDETRSRDLCRDSDQGRRLVQFWSLSPGTRLNSRSLLETRVSPADLA